MAMACGRNRARSLPNLLQSVARCTASSSSSSSSSTTTSSSSCLAPLPPCSSPAVAASGKWMDLRVGSFNSGHTEIAEALQIVAERCKQNAGRVQDEHTTHASCGCRSLGTGNILGDQRSSPLSRNEIFQVVEKVSWARPWKRYSQAKQLRFIYTCPSGTHAPSPPCSDLSVGADLSSNHEQEKLDPFALVADELALLGQRLRGMVTAEVPRLAEAAEYFFKLGVEGKRFRPMLGCLAYLCLRKYGELYKVHQAALAHVLLLMASSLTVSPSSMTSYVSEETLQQEAQSSQRIRQQRIAEITEMIHVASLLHDDVLDHADTRRGIGSLNAIMGNKLAVLAGDFLLARASVALASLQNTEVVVLISKALEHLVTGEMMQLTTETQEICSMEYYMQKTFYKTASLMANSCKSIALLADQPREVANLAFEYGRHLGLAYQLVDDALDFIGTKASLGKPALSDLAQGIATAPVLFALEEHPRMYELIKRKFRKSGDIDLALEMVKSSQGIFRTQQLAAHHAQEAVLAISGLPPSSSVRSQLCRRALKELTQYVLTRSK